MHLPHAALAVCVCAYVSIHIYTCICVCMCYLGIKIGPHFALDRASNLGKAFLFVSADADAAASSNFTSHRPKQRTSA